MRSETRLEQNRYSQFSRELPPGAVELRDRRELPWHRGAGLRQRGRGTARLVGESGICETLRVARPDDAEFREVQVPASCYPPGGSPAGSWRTLYYAHVAASFAAEMLGETEASEGSFADGLWVQEVINAVEISHRERRWVDLPLDCR